MLDDNMMNMHHAHLAACVFYTVLGANPITLPFSAVGAATCYLVARAIYHKRKLEWV